MSTPHFFQIIWTHQFENFAPADFSLVVARNNVVCCHGPFVRAFSQLGDVEWELRESDDFGSSAFFERTESRLYFEHKSPESGNSIVVLGDHDGTIVGRHEINGRIHRFGAARRGETVGLISSESMGGAVYLLSEGNLERHQIGAAAQGISATSDGWIVHGQRGVVKLNDAGQTQIVTSGATSSVTAHSTGRLGIISGKRGAYEFALVDPDGPIQFTTAASSPFIASSDEALFFARSDSSSAILTALDWNAETLWEAPLGSVGNHRFWVTNGWVGVSSMSGFLLYDAQNGIQLAESVITWAPPLLLEDTCYWTGNSAVVATTTEPAKVDSENSTNPE